MAVPRRIVAGVDNAEKIHIILYMPERKFNSLALALFGGFNRVVQNVIQNYRQLGIFNITEICGFNLVLEFDVLLIAYDNVFIQYQIEHFVIRYAQRASLVKGFVDFIDIFSYILNIVETANRYVMIFCIVKYHMKFVVLVFENFHICFV